MVIRGKWLWAAIFIVPAVELFGFLLVSEHIGVSKALLLLLATSVIGLVMMRFEGKKVLQDSKALLESGQPPGRTMLDGLCVFMGGMMLILPGFVTDLIGFTLLFPLTRPVYRFWMMKWIQRKMKNGTFTYYRK
ncbi:FxsA family protein [Paenibacillus glufosinatiresistens]|uniref:FxsA family protein n=1 Tax=Paenibacillus glufosinatiresistens TaxID=3070657 RepID=UPI00286DB79B|nr:FxsA family protein [Paenibacillus sp. YX.27]